MYLPQKAMILPCQAKCLDFTQSAISDKEQDCLAACLDKMAFFDNTTYELDSAAMLTQLEGKPKKAFLYYSRRIEDLTNTD